MSFVNKTEVKSGLNKAVGLGEVLVGAIGGLAGFFAADFIGFGALIDSVWSTTGIDSLFPIMDKLQPIIVALIAAGIYIGVGVGVSKISFGNKYIGLVTKGIGWFAIGAGIREVLISATSGVNALKSAGTGA